MSQEIIEMLDQIEAKSLAKIEEVKTESASTVETVKAEINEKMAALEAKISTVQAPALIKSYKTVSQEVNRSVKEQLKDFYTKSTRAEKEIKLFESTDQYDAYMSEASAIGNPAGYGSGYNVGGRTGYDPMFVSLRLLNPMRGVSRQVSTDGSTYQFRSKQGNAGAQWGYAIQNNGAPTTQTTGIWQLVLQDVNCQFPIRTASLDDIDGLEGTVVSDMLAEFSQVEGQSMIQNNDQSDVPNTYGGTLGLRGLNQYGGSNAAYTGGTTSVASYGSSGIATTNGLVNLATYDQLTTNGNVAGASNVVFKDIVNFIYALPQQYWTPTAKIIISPLFLAQIRGLVDDNGTPVFERMSPLVSDGIVGKLLGFDVVVNNYLDTPSDAGVDKANLFPMYFGDWNQGHCIVDRMNMILRRYDQTAPGFITFFGEKRLATSVVDPFSIIRYRSTATANSI